MPAVVPDLPELFEEAFERIGLEMRSGYDLRSIRRSLALLTLEWANRGLNLFTVESGDIPLVVGQGSYTLPADTIDLIEHMLRIDGRDTAIERISVSGYAQLPDKGLAGRPTRIYIDRGAQDVRAHLWPVPDRPSYRLAFYRLRYIDGLASGVGGSTVMIPPRFVPALVSGLAYFIAMKRPDAKRELPLLQAEYEKQFALAADEDRDRASVFLSPWGG